MMITLIISCFSENSESDYYYYSTSYYSLLKLIVNSFFEMLVLIAKSLY